MERAVNTVDWVSDRSAGAGGPGQHVARSGSAGCAVLSDSVGCALLSDSVGYALLSDSVGYALLSDSVGNVPVARAALAPAFRWLGVISCGAFRLAGPAR